ncbi:MAG: peptide MFS transporter [Novosphingobium sp.]|uniref:peptide MFS transporter n=1 Tax=Novosphingobium sp. TaxID=1874826 RepID=UPI0032B89650
MTTTSPAADKSFLGHPKGLAYLAFTEMWERFSYYGMTALLTLYMIEQLLLPEHAANVAGLAALRSAIEVSGPMSNLAFASIVYGWYSGLVYLTPILGGWIADRILGKKRTVVLGALLMSAGHLAMTFDQSFLLALLLLILGSGCLKGNISAQVGTLYPREAASMRDRGFAIFSTGINIGAASGPLITGAVYAIYGWHAGFAVAAALMLLALVAYLAGQRHLPETPPQEIKQAAKTPLTPDERRQVWALAAVIALIIPAEITYPMVWSIGIVWVKQQVALGWIPAPWFGSVDSIGSIIAAPILLALWAAQARVRREPDSVGKIAIGTLLTGVFALVMAGASWFSPAPQSVSVVLALIAFLGMGLGWMYYWPTALSLVSRVAPAKINSTLVGAAFLCPFLAHTLAGYIGSYYDQMSPAAFWTMDGAIGLIGAAILFALNRPLSRALEPGPA